MSVHRTTTATTRVHVGHSGRDGITIATLRQFVDEATDAGIPDTTRVRIEDKLAGEGANRSGYVEATHTQPVEDTTP